jgi:dTDP-4-dehydrorhamnose 3,5-epimerase
MSTEYVAEAQRGFRWNDPAFGIQWPLGQPTMNDRDATYPDFADTEQA